MKQLKDLVTSTRIHQDDIKDKIKGRYYRKDFETILSNAGL